MRLFIPILLSVSCCSPLRAGIPESVAAQADALIKGYVTSNCIIDSTYRSFRFTCTITVMEVCNEHSAWHQSPGNLMPGDTLKNVIYHGYGKLNKLQDSAYHIVALTFDSDSHFTLIDPLYFASYFTHYIDLTDYCGRFLETNSREHIVQQCVFARDTNEVETKTGYRQDSSISTTRLRWDIGEDSYYEDKTFDSTGALFYHTKTIYKDRKFGWRYIQHVYCKDGEKCHSRNSHRHISWWQVRWKIYQFFHPRWNRHF